MIKFLDMDIKFENTICCFQNLCPGLVGNGEIFPNIKLLAINDEMLIKF